MPALLISLDRKIITPIEHRILSIAVEKLPFDAGDIRHLFPGRAASEVSRNIRSLREKEMILPESPKKRKYFISFRNNYLMRGVITQLGDNGFIPLSDRA